MAAKRTTIPAKHLFNGFRQSVSQPWSNPSRSMATAAPLPPTMATKATSIDVSANSTTTSSVIGGDGGSLPSGAIHRPEPFQPQRNPFLTTTQCTLHSFPRFEPTRLITYPNTHLGVPLRKDILHRAVIYEGDNTRQGTASTKWRSEVHGSGRKIRPQKGTGSARLGDKKSPMLRGGGVAFGPKPRDFGTDLPSKVYDLAWRTALSYRYRQGELFLVDGIAEIVDVHQDSLARYMRDLLVHNNLGHGSGRSLFITREIRGNLFATLASGNMGRHARALDVADVDVKDLLEQGQLVVERGALDWILKQHESDLDPTLRLGRWRSKLMEENALAS